MDDVYDLGSVVMESDEYLTPEAARELAALLIEAASLAEGL